MRVHYACLFCPLEGYCDEPQFDTVSARPCEGTGSEHALAGHTVDECTARDCKPEILSEP